MAAFWVWTAFMNSHDSIVATVFGVVIIWVVLLDAFETVVLRLSQQAAPAENAARLLGEFMEGWRPEPEPA